MPTKGQSLYKKAYQRGKEELKAAGKDIKTIAKEGGNIGRLAKDIRPPSSEYKGALKRTAGRAKTLVEGPGTAVTKAGIKAGMKAAKAVGKGSSFAKTATKKKAKK